MENINKNETFSYTYSAKQQDEVKKIAGKYMPREENKIEQLRRLDKSTTKLGTTISIALGTISSLIMGTGMSVVMVLKDYFVVGIIVGVIGMIGVGLAYPIFKTITKKQREKLAPQIKKLSEELLGQQ